MKVIVVEDEILAAERLVNLIHRYDKEIEVLAVLDSITSSLEWLKNNEAPDLGFFDIQLADGLSLDIFEKIDLNFPVIFTTAYDEYALKAFKTNGIDYLLKPISLEELDSAFQKYVTLRQSLGSDVKKELQEVFANLQFASTPKVKYKKRFVVKKGHNILAVNSEDILYFFSENKTTWLMHKQGKKYHLELTLEQLLEKIDPANFFRINRKYILAFSSIQNITAYSGNRLKVNLKHAVEEEVLVSRERVGTFKQWLDQ